MKSNVFKITIFEKKLPAKTHFFEAFINSSNNLLFACQKDIIFFNRVWDILGNNNHDPITVSSGSSVDKGMINLCLQ